MRDIQEIRKLLKDRRLDIVSKETGIHRTTISYIRNNEKSNPTLRVLELLNKYFDNTDK